MKRVNPFARLYDYQNKTPSDVQVNEMGDFPLLIDVELTNRCNMRCIFCAQRAMKRARVNMTEEHYSMLLDETAPRGTPLRFIRWGEPLLHPRFLDFIRMAKEKGLLLHVTTNGLLMDQAMAAALVDLELDSIKFSFQGVDAKTYSEMRRADAFNKVIGNLELLHLTRGRREKPFIHVSTSITRENEEQVASFKALAGRFADSVEAGNTNLSRYNIFELDLTREERDAFMAMYEQETVDRQYKHCPEVFTKLSVNSDGSVSACCGDYDNAFVVGNLGEDTLESIWKNQQMMEIRNILARMQHKRLTLCNSCYVVYRDKSKAINPE